MIEMEIPDVDSSLTTVKKIDYPPEILEELDKLNRSTLGDVTKKLIKRRLLGGIKQCCVCQGLPEYEVIYQLGEATKIERYCSKCFSKREETDSKYIDPNQFFVMATKL